VDGQPERQITAISQTTTGHSAGTQTRAGNDLTPLKGGSWHIEAVIQTANGAPRTNYRQKFPVATQVVSIEELLSLKGSSQRRSAGRSVRSLPDILGGGSLPINFPRTARTVGICGAGSLRVGR